MFKIHEFRSSEEYHFHSKKQMELVAVMCPKISKVKNPTEQIKNYIYWSNHSKDIKKGSIGKKSAVIEAFSITSSKNLGSNDIYFNLLISQIFQMRFFYDSEALCEIRTLEKFTNLCELCLNGGDFAKDPLRELFENIGPQLSSLE